MNVLLRHCDTEGVTDASRASLALRRRDPAYLQATRLRNAVRKAQEEGAPVCWIKSTYGAVQFTLDAAARRNLREHLLPLWETLGPIEASALPDLSLCSPAQLPVIGVPVEDHNQVRYVVGKLSPDFLTFQQPEAQRDEPGHTQSEALEPSRDEALSSGPQVSELDTSTTYTFLEIMSSTHGSLIRVLLMDCDQEGKVSAALVYICLRWAAPSYLKAFGASGVKSLVKKAQLAGAPVRLIPRVDDNPSQVQLTLDAATRAGLRMQMLPFWEPPRALESSAPANKSIVSPEAESLPAANPVQVSLML